MAFERSLSGQSNRALFFGVDMVIYVEGGRETNTAVESYDGMFWKKVFQAIRPELRVRTIPKGSKRNLLDIATSLGGNKLGNVLIAIDRDYDDLFNCNKDLPNVIKTFGYSYENDAFYHDNLESLFYDICPICEMSEPVTQFIKESVSSFTKQMWWPQFADVCGYMASVAVLDRDHPQKYFTGNSYGSIPHLSMSALMSDIRKSNKIQRVEVKSAPLKFDMLPRLIVGHIYEVFCFKLLSYLQHRHSKSQKLTKSSVTAAAIQSIYSFLITNKESDLSVYYSSKLANL